MAETVLVTAHQLKKTFGARDLFEGLSFTLTAGSHVGLIGPNGAGKSTLMKILAGLDTPDRGDVTFARGTKVGYLAQSPEFDSHVTVLAAVLGEGVDQHDWSEAGSGLELISRLELDTLGDPSLVKVANLSRGWQKRVALACELAKAPDLLLLDEPTNHLDLESILWLEEYLARFRGALLLVTHDRAFLQKVTTRILEVDRRNPGGVLSVDGDYATFLERKEAWLENQASRQASLQNKLRRETEWLRQGAKARTTKQQARIQRAHALAQEVSSLREKHQVSNTELEWDTESKGGPKRLLVAENLTFQPPGETQPLFAGVHVVLGPGSRLGLIGRNGCGKSTLIRTLLGETDSRGTQAIRGKIKRSDRLEVAYFSQNREALDPSKTLLRTVCESGEFVVYRGESIHVRTYLSKFLFSPAQADTPVGKLSGGEQSRVLLALLMLRPANLLVMDEPTNDLDVATLDVLEESLEEFPGAVILVSHDRYFLDQVCDDLLAFGSPDKKLQAFSSMSQWADWHRALPSAGASSGVVSTTEARTEAPAATKSKKLSYKDQRELDQMEPTILQKEEHLARLTQEAEDPSLGSNAKRLGELHSEIASLQAEIDRLYARWSQLTR